MAERVRVRRLNDVEGRQLQQIVRRGGKSDRSIVKWRRAMVVLASAGGNDVAAIARLVQTSPDRVREMIHRFNDLGMRSLDPQWAGGRPRQITTTDRALIVKTATTRPTKLGLSVHALVDPQARRLPRRHATGRKVIDRSGTVAADPDRRGDHVPADQDVEGVARPAKEQKLARIEWLLEHARDRTFAFDEFGPLTIRPGRRCRRGRRRASPNGCGRTITSRTDRGSSTPGTRSARTACAGTSSRVKGCRADVAGVASDPGQRR